MGFNLFLSYSKKNKLSSNLNYTFAFKLYSKANHWQWICTQFDRLTEANDATVQCDQ